MPRQRRARPEPPRAGWRPVLAAALISPALVFLYGSYLEPALWTVRTSFQRLDALRGAGMQPAGTANYDAIFKNGFGDAVGFAFSLAGLPLVGVLVVAPLIAWFGHRTGTPGRWLAGAALAVPAVCFAPAAYAAAWRADRTLQLGDPGSAAVTVRVASGLTSFGLATALATTLYLAALRRRDPARQPWQALTAAVALAGFATCAAALQEFTYPLVITGGGPHRATTTPLLAVFTIGFQQFQFGPAAAASVLLMLLLAAFGVATTLMIIGARMRIEVDDAQPSADHPTGWDRNRVSSGAVVKLLVTAVLAHATYAAWPWLRAIFAGHPAPPGTGSAAAILGRTWFPPLIATVIGVAAAALAGYGIGAMRPLKERSEWLLLPFAPFLFVGVGPLALRAYAGGATASRYDSLLGLVPPTRLAVPALFVFTLLAKGLTMRETELRGTGVVSSWWYAYGRPGVPMIAIVAMATWLAQSQDLLWPLLSAGTRYVTGPAVLALAASGGYSGSRGVPVGLALPGWLALILIVLAVVAQVRYLNRIALRVGDPERPGGSGLPAPGRFATSGGPPTPGRSPAPERSTAPGSVHRF